MITVYKYDIQPGEFSLEFPGACEVLCVRVQDGQARIWVKVDTSGHLRSYNFVCVGTGHQLIEDWYSPLTYIGTFEIKELIFHLFRRDNT